MHNLSPKSSKMAKRLTVWLLLVAMLMQALTGVFATTDLFDGVLGAVSGSNSGNVVNGIGQINSEEIISQLKKDLMASINENLIKKVEEYELTGEVGVILTFEDESLLEIYNSSRQAKTIISRRRRSLWLSICTNVSKSPTTEDRRSISLLISVRNS